MAGVTAGHLPRIINGCPLQIHADGRGLRPTLILDAPCLLVHARRRIATLRGLRACSHRYTCTFTVRVSVLLLAPWSSVTLTCSTRSPVDPLMVLNRSELIS